MLVIDNKIQLVTVGTLDKTNYIKNLVKIFLGLGVFGGEGRRGVCLTWSNLQNPKNPIYILYNLTIKTI
jgi:hypothetical protein